MAGGGAPQLYKGVYASVLMCVVYSESCVCVYMFLS